MVAASRRKGWVTQANGRGQRKHSATKLATSQRWVRRASTSGYYTAGAGQARGENRKLFLSSCRGTPSFFAEPRQGCSRLRQVAGLLARATVQRRRPIRWLVVWLFCLLAIPSHAQFSGYFAPGEQLFEAPLSLQTLQTAMEAARWRLGPLRLAPYFALRNLQYLDNVYGTAQGKVADFSAAVASGLLGYVPFGRKAMLAGYGVPEYVWWRKLENRRVWNGEYGAAALFQGSRVRFLGRLADHRRAVYPSFDLLQPINGRESLALGEAELRVAGRFWVFAASEERRYRFRRGELPREMGSLRELERNQRASRAGLRWRPREGVVLGAAYGKVEVTFPYATVDRGAEGSGLVVGADWEGKSVRGHVAAERFSLEPQPGSAFPAFRGTTWRYDLGNQTDRRILWGFYGSRRLSFALAGAAYATVRREGVRLGARLAPGSTLLLFAEQGRESWVPPTRSPVDVRAAGFQLNLPLAGELGFSLQASREVRDQNQAELSVTRLLATVRWASGQSWW